MLAAPGGRGARIRLRAAITTSAPIRVELGENPISRSRYADRGYGHAAVIKDRRPRNTPQRLLEFPLISSAKPRC